MLKPYDIVVKTTAEFSAAAVKLSKQGHGTLWIDGEIEVPTGITTLAGAISIRGIGDNATLFRSSKSGSIIVGQYWSPISYGKHQGVPLDSDLSVNESEFTAPINANDGDWVLFLSDQWLENAPWHSVRDPYFPGEMHQIRRKIGDNKYKLNDMTIDPFVTKTDGSKILKPVVSVIPILKTPGLNASNIIIDNLHFKSKDITNNNIFLFGCLDGIDIKNCTWENVSGEGAPTWMTFRFCSNVKIHDNNVYGAANIDASAYFIVLTVVNGVQINNNFGQETRHFVTTGGIGVSHPNYSSLRYGTPIKVLVDSNVILSSQNTRGSALPPLDTHAEGYGIVFSNNLIVCAGKGGSGRACNIRSRGATFTNNTIIGDGLVNGVRAYASDVVITNNIFRKCHNAISLYPFPGLQGTTTPWDNATITHNTILDSSSSSSGPVVSLMCGKNHVFSHNTINRSNGWAFYATNAEGLTFTHNTIVDIGMKHTRGMVVFGQDNKDICKDCLISNNVFSKHLLGNSRPFLSTIEFLGHCEDIRIIDNTFDKCKVDSLISFNVGANIKLYKNNMSQDLNATAINLGSMKSSEVKVLGNYLDGYLKNTFAKGGDSTSFISNSLAKNYV